MQELEKVKLIKEQIEPLLLKVKGVVGVGIGKGADDRVCIKAYVHRDSPELRRQLLQEADGVPIEVQVVGKVIAY